MSDRSEHCCYRRECAEQALENVRLQTLVNTAISYWLVAAALLNEKDAEIARLTRERDAARAWHNAGTCPQCEQMKDRLGEAERMLRERAL